MEKKVSVLVDENTIIARIKEMAKQITEDFAGESLMCICVLKGGIMLMSDLLKHIDLPTGIGYIAVSSYDDRTESKGEIEIKFDSATDIAGKNVLLIEDIADTGHTIGKLLEILKERNPKNLKICVLVDRPDRRETSVQLDYVGFTIFDKFLVGYGLDYAERYRNLPFIGALEDLDEE